MYTKSKADKINKIDRIIEMLQATKTYIENNEDTRNDLIAKQIERVYIETQRLIAMIEKVYME